MNGKSNLAVDHGLSTKGAKGPAGKTTEKPKPALHERAVAAANGTDVAAPGHNLGRLPKQAAYNAYNETMKPGKEAAEVKQFSHHGKSYYAVMTKPKDAKPGDNWNFQFFNLDGSAASSVDTYPD